MESGYVIFELFIQMSDMWGVFLFETMALKSIILFLRLTVWFFILLKKIPTLFITILN